MLRLAVIGDVHFSSAPKRDSLLLIHRSEEILATALRQIAQNPKPPDLVIQLGDLIDGVDQSRTESKADLDRAVNMFDQSGFRWTWVLGNHDLQGVHERRWLVSRLRRSQSYGEIVVGDKVLLLLDSACEEVYGRIEGEQQAWLEEMLDLHRHRRIFVFLHHVFDWSFDSDMYVEDSETLQSMLTDSPAVKAVFMGHSHTSRIETTDGMHEIATGGLTNWPLMFRWIDISPENICVRSDKVLVPPEIDAEAQAAFQRHPEPWFLPVKENDLNADLTPR